MAEAPFLLLFTAGYKIFEEFMLYLVTDVEGLLGVPLRCEYESFLILNCLNHAVIGGCYNLKALGESVNFPAVVRIDICS